METEDRKKFKISIIDFMLENGKHEVGIDKKGNKVFLGDLVEYNGATNWFVVYRYGVVLLKEVGMMAMIVIKDFSTIEKQNVFGTGVDWAVIAFTDDPIFEKVKHLLGEEFAEFEPMPEPVTPVEKEPLEIILDQLETWIDRSEKTGETLRKGGLLEQAATHEAYAQSYWNVKQFIQVNFM